MNGVSLEEIYWEKIWAVLNRSLDEEIMISPNAQGYIETLMRCYYEKKCEESEIENEILGTKQNRNEAL